MVRENPGRRRKQRYQLIRQLGMGGMAEVWLALDQRLDRLVAIKVLRPIYRRDPALVARLEQEARAVAQLESPAIVHIYDVVRSREGDPAIIMEYVPGGDLRGLLSAQGPLPLERALTFLQEITTGVAAAHSMGLIHCDLKPGNILLTRDGHAKVTDFGIARVLSAAPEAEPTAVWGTSHYLAPEQAQGLPLSPAADVYSLGVLLFEMVSGHLPFPGDDPLTVAVAHLQEPLPDLQQLVPTLPTRITHLVARLLDKDPASRPANAGALLTILQRYQTLTSEHTRIREVGAAPTLGPPREAATAPREAATAPLARRQPLPDIPPEPTEEERPPSSFLDGPLYNLGIVGLVVSSVLIMGLLLVLGPYLPTRGEASLASGGTPTSVQVAPEMMVLPTLASALTATPPPTATAVPTATSAPQSRAGNGPEWRVPQMAPHHVIVDGNLAEWSGRGVPITAITLGIARWDSPRDLSGEVWAAWDEEAFYLAVHVLDDTHVQTQRGLELVRGDSIALWLDTDLAGDFETASGNADDWHFGFSPGDFEQSRPEGVVYLPTDGATRTETLEVRAQPRPDGYTLEARIPWDGLAVQARPGLTLGYGVELIDNDLVDMAEEQSRASSSPRLRWNRPTTFAPLVLMP